LDCTGVHDAGAGRVAGGLDVLQVEVERPGKHPLAILTHGTAVDTMERGDGDAGGLSAQAIWFARRGYVVLVVVRKGYGRRWKIAARRCIGKAQAL
jgi:hypothetical protein